MSPKSKSKRKPPKQEFTPTTTPNPTPSDFSFAIARIAVSQISQSVGLRAAQPSAVETLTRIATKYIEAVASASASYAAAANRTDANVFDFANALQDLQSAQGFKGGSRLHESAFCALGSSVLSDLSKFVKWNDEIPFARPIPRRRKLVTENRVSDSPGDLELRFRSLNVPRWLPAFPDLKRSVPKRKNGEELWENSCAGGGVRNESESGNWSGGKGKGVCLELGVKSSKVGRVRFRIGGGAAAEEKAVAAVAGLGVNLRSGVCRGGKRVCWGKDKIGYNFSTRIHELVGDDGDDKTVV